MREGSEKTNTTVYRTRGTWRTAGFTLIELMIVIAIIGILTAVLIPSFINAMDRTRYRACLSALASVKTAIEMLRTEVNIKSNVVCAGGVNLINNCIAEEVIGKIGGKWAAPADLETRISRSCEAWGGAGLWTAAGITINADAEYDIKGHSSKGFNECDICITEIDYSPTAQDCLLGGAVTCP